MLPAQGYELEERGSRKQNRQDQMTRTISRTDTVLATTLHDAGVIDVRMEISYVLLCLRGKSARRVPADKHRPPRTDTAENGKRR